MAREAEIENDEVGSIDLPAMQRLDSVGRFDHRKALAAQRVRRHVEKVGIVFDDQDLHEAVRWLGR